MATNIKNILLDRTIPAWIKENYPMFEAFLSAYYEWMEQSQQPIDLIKNFREYRDVDRTIDDFIDHFRKEYAAVIPQDALGDKRLFLKQIKNLYLNKGNQAAFKFLFKIIFNETVEFYYPKVDILKLDDGKWNQVITIKVLQSDITDIAELFANIGIGAVNNGTCNVSSIFQYNDRGLDIYELNLANIKGIFDVDELITFGTETCNVLEVLSDIDITVAGAGYGVGETFEVKDGVDVVSTGYIKNISRGAVTGLTIAVAGTGYNGTQREIDEFFYLPVNTVWEGHNWFTGTLMAEDSSDYDFFNSPMNFPITTVLVNETADIIQITDTPFEIGTGASGHVSLVSQDGAILAVVVDNVGDDYNIPVASVISETGIGGEISVTGGGGSISRVQLNTFPIFDPDSSGIDTLTVDITSSGGTGATLTPVFGGNVIRYEGSWVNDDGFLDSTKVIQDDYYYQDFSYVLLSGISQERWQDVVNKIAHPLGLKNFGKLKFIAKITTDAELVDTSQTTA